MARILIVDDANIGRINIKNIVVGAGHEVVGEAENGLLAFQMFKQYRPDLVTMDITMPVMDGITSLKQIIAFEPTAKVVMISALGQQLKVLQAIKSGAKYFLVKPFRGDDLVKSINTVLNIEQRLPEATVTQPVQSENQGENDECGLTVENAMGTILIKISAQMSEKDLKTLKTVIEGIINISPLKVVFDFQDVEYMNINILKKIYKAGEILKVAGGDVRVTSNNEQLWKCLKAANIEINND